jgi:23S rRNA (pseudouridine1915-N3)-methyltransferase
MKFSEISQEDWANLQPYLDTCLLPVTGVTGIESPWEATQILEELRDALELIEIPYKGRVVTYPALHYVGEESSIQANIVCLKLRNAGFKYIIMMSTRQDCTSWSVPNADLLLYVDPNELKASFAQLKQNISSQIQQLWRNE